MPSSTRCNKQQRDQAPHNCTHSSPDAQVSVTYHPHNKYKIADVCHAQDESACNQAEARLEAHMNH
eukprot:1157437-Pelagomonas_calceolata.AAC.13